MENGQWKTWVRLSLLLAFGFACAEAWPPTLHMVASPDNALSAVANRPPHGLCMPSLVLAVCVCAVVCLLGKRTAVVLDRPWIPWVVSTVMALLGASLAIPLFAAGADGWSRNYAEVAIGVSGLLMVFLYLSWLRALSVFPAQEMIFTLFLAQVLTGGINAFLTSGSTYAAVAAATLMPLVSATCLRLVPKESSSATCDEGDSAGRYPEGRVFSVLLARLAVVVFLFGTVNHLFQGEFDALLHSRNSQLALGYHGAAFAALIVLFAFLYVLMAHRERFRFGYMYRFMFLMGLTSILLVPLAWLGRGTTVGYACSVMMYQLVFLFVWSLCASVFRGRRSDGYLFFGVVYGCWSAGSLAGAWASMLLMGRLSSDWGLLMVVLAALAVAVGYSTVFTESNANALVRILPLRAKRPFKSKCLAMAKHYGLSPRETEVAVLIARGRDSAHIQEKLFLSRSTVQTHRMHIYRKLDIHNRQELLDIIEREEE